MNGQGSAANGKAQKKHATAALRFGEAVGGHYRRRNGGANLRSPRLGAVRRMEVGESAEAEVHLIEPDHRVISLDGHGEAVEAAR
ncbi:MAG: hypothetical protein ABI305_09800, partial [Tepidiformaceae bacterium]